MNSTKTSRVSKGEHLSEMFFTLLPHIYLTVLCHCLYYHCRSMICHYQCAPSNQCSLYLCLSILCLSFCSGADCLYVCFSASSMSPCVCVCVVRLWCFLSVSGLRLSQGSPPQLPPLLRQRAALPMPLCSPPVWLFTASSVSISTAAPPLTKAYSRRTGKGHCRAWVQWVCHRENKNTFYEHHICSALLRHYSCVL